MTRRVLLAAIASVAGLCLWPRRLNARTASGEAFCRCPECAFVRAQERSHARLLAMMRAEGLDPDRMSRFEIDDYAIAYVNRVFHENRQRQSREGQVRRVSQEEMERFVVDAFKTSKLRP